jgi:hypothetical protein
MVKQKPLKRFVVNVVTSDWVNIDSIRLKLKNFVYHDCDVDDYLAEKKWKDVFFASSVRVAWRGVE